MTQPVDSSILHEIVRVIEQRRKVPLKVIVKSKEYLLTYLEDHQRRLEEALQRFDHDRLNMLYGQLASKIKYQLLRRVPARAVPEAKKPAAAKAKPAAKPAAHKRALAAARKKAPAAARKKPAVPAKKKPAARKGAAGAKRRPTKARAARKKKR